MIRLLALMGVVALVSACAQYREPTADCFPFLASVVGDPGCDFIPLGGPAREVVDA